jgi:hypothetical protein
LVWRETFFKPRAKLSSKRTPNCSDFFSLTHSI